MNEIIARMMEAEVIRKAKNAERSKIYRELRRQGLTPKKRRGPKPVVEDHIAAAKRLPPDPLLAWVKSRSTEVKFDFWGLWR